MNFLEKGYVNIIKEFESLEKGWDGYGGEPIKKKVLDQFRDMSNIGKYFELFRLVGFAQTDIEVVPTSKGNIQLEAELHDRYLEFEIK